MALSKILENSITDGVVSAAKLKDFAAAVDLNGVELILDADQDTSITADTDDRIDFKIAGVEHISISNSSGDTIIKPMVDAKDIVFQQYDGNKIFEINDGNFVAVSGAAAGPGEIRIYEDTDNGTHYTGFKSGNNTASVAYVLPTADGSASTFLQTDGSGTLSWASAAPAADDISAGDAAVTLATSAGNITIDAQGGDTDIIFKGTDNSSDITMLTLDGSAAGEAIFNAGIVIADAGNIGSASDKDAIAIASNGVVTFSQAPVFPDGSIAVADLDIDGATDIGAAIVDADLFIIDDGAGGTNRKVAASRIKTYAGGLTGVSTGSGNVTIDDGNLIVASGHGIDFSATANLSAGDATMTQELFDDYEEGTWTAAIASNSGSITVSTSNDECTYVKIGRHVFLNGSLVAGSVSSPSGRLQINNKPYNSTGGEGGHRGVGTCMIHSPASDVGSAIVPMIFEDYDPIRFHNGSSGDEINANIIDASAEIRFAINYHAG